MWALLLDNQYTNEGFIRYFWLFIYHSVTNPARRVVELQTSTGKWTSHCIYLEGPMKLPHAWIPGWWSFPFKAFLKGKEAADPPPLELHRSESKEEEKGCSAGPPSVLMDTQASHCHRSHTQMEGLLLVWWVTVTPKVPASALRKEKLTLPGM